MLSAIAYQGSGAPSATAPEGTFYWDTAANVLYINNDGTNNWTQIGAGASLPLAAVLGTAPITGFDFATPRRNNAAGFSLGGYLEPLAYTDQASVSQCDANGLYWQQSGNSSATVWGISAEANRSTGDPGLFANPIHIWKFKLSSVADVRVGLELQMSTSFTGGALSLTGNPNHQCLGIIYKTDRSGGGDTNWQLESHNYNPNHTITDTGVAVDTDEWVIVLEVNSGAPDIRARFYRGDGTQVGGETTVSTNIPTVTLRYAQCFGLYAVAGGAKNVNHYGYATAYRGDYTA